MTSVNSRSVLYSNHETLELGYKDYQPQPVDDGLWRVACLVGSTVAWPLVFLGTAFFLLPASLFGYFKAVRKIGKMVNILSDQNLLQKYSEKRIRHCEEKIKKLKDFATLMIEFHSINEDDVGLPIPTSFRPTDHPWREFPWDQFMETDFFQKSNISNNKFKKIILRDIEILRTEISCLSRQKILLSNDEGRLESVKTIAKMSLIKYSFIRERLKNCSIFYAVCLLPAGAFFADWKTYDRSTYERNREFLPAVEGFQNYQDLLDAHNQLIKENNFIVPLIRYNDFIAALMSRPLLRELDWLGRG